MDRIVRLEFTSAFDMLDFVQVVNDHIGRGVGFDEDSIHWIGVAIRECVINAIKHGNQMNRDKKVAISYTVHLGRFEIHITDEGSGFEPCDVPDPTAVENIERPCGRGLMLMRHYMTEVSFHGRGNSVRIFKVLRIGKK